MALMSSVGSQYGMDVHGPPFWASPAISSFPAPLPSNSVPLAPAQRRSLRPRVPPTPVINHVMRPVMAGSFGRAGGDFDLGCRVLTDLGPFKCHERRAKSHSRKKNSLLHDDYQIAACVPVRFFGTIETQFRLHTTVPTRPSQTSVLMNTRCRDREQAPRFVDDVFRGTGLDSRHALDAP